jgi:formate dehydrogenase gamma subunit
MVPTIRRFSIYRIVEHQVNAITFINLVITGLAQRFHGSGWAAWTIDLFGGIDNTRLVHRWSGCLFSLILLQHAVIASYLFLARRARPAMVITKKDFLDAVQNLRYYFGISEHPAQCDRYDYKQKFEYWGVLLGGVLMVVSGFMLWFPTTIFHIMPFLPGQLIPAAKVAHSNEAMMAFLIIVTWHIYNAVFSPEVFPLDTSIFTGRISVERMRHEHPIEYERILADETHEPDERAQESGQEEHPPGEPNAGSART